MGVLKGVVVGLLSFLLFLSLSVFGVAFAANSTILNPSFVTSELDRLDVSSMVEELVMEQTTEDEIEDALINTIDKVEPMVKAQVGTIIDDIYDYLLGESENLDLAITLKNTLLSSDFILSLVDELDVSSLADEFLSEQLAEEIPPGMDYLEQYLDESLPGIIEELEPWLKEQISVAAGPIADYLLGESRSLSIAIPSGPVMESLKDVLWDAFSQSPPFEYAGLSLVQLERQFNEVYQEFIDQFPPTFEFDESFIGTEVPETIAEAITDAEDVLGQTKQHVSTYQLGYKLLIGFMVLLVLCIILINRNVKITIRSLGITSLIYGAIEFGGLFAAKHFGLAQLPEFDLPSAFQEWLPQFASNLLSPLQMFTIGMMAVGVVLIIVSVVYKRKPVE
jgi:hypothetical protein